MLFYRLTEVVDRQLVTLQPQSENAPDRLA